MEAGGNGDDHNDDENEEDYDCNAHPPAAALLVCLAVLRFLVPSVTYWEAALFMWCSILSIYSPSASTITVIASFCSFFSRNLQSALQIESLAKWPVSYSCSSNAFASPISLLDEVLIINISFTSLQSFGKKTYWKHLCLLLLPLSTDFNSLDFVDFRICYACSICWNNNNDSATWKSCTDHPSS